MSFIPEYTTDAICVGDNTNLCLTDHLEEMENAIAGKAPADHSHTGYAEANHTHAPSSIGAATEDHTHTPASIGAATADHSHNYAAPTHSHAQSEISGLSDALAAKANASDMSAKADLVDGKIPTSQLPGYVDDVLEYTALANFPTTGEAGKIYVATDTNKSYRWSGSAYVEISASIALGETSATAYRGDRGKIAYDHSQNVDVHVTETQKASWDSKAAGNHGHSYNDLSDKPTIPTIPASLPANGGNADTVDGKHASDFATSEHTHTPASIGAAAASHNHSGYAASGHTHTASDVGAAAASHTHTAAAIGAAPASHEHSEYAASNHGHSDYASSNHSHTASDVGAAAASHTHTAAAIGAAPASHEHSEYAASNHGHSDYASSNHSHTASDVGALPASGGTVSGNLTVNGSYLYTAQIAPKDGGSYSIGSSSNRYYSTYLKVNPNVSSDLRCKRDIETMDIEALAAFVDKLAVVNYNYIDDEADEPKRIGLIAQDVVAADPEIAKGCIEQDKKGFYSLRAADLVFPLIAAVQALTKRVEELEGK